MSACKVPIHRVRAWTHYGRNGSDGDDNVYGNVKKRDESVTLKLCLV